MPRQLMVHVARRQPHTFKLASFWYFPARVLRRVVLPATNISRPRYQQQLLNKESRGSQNVLLFKRVLQQSWKFQKLCGSSRRRLGCSRYHMRCGRGTQDAHRL